MAKKGSGSETPEEILAAYKKEIGGKYMDGLISDKEYENLLYAKEAELGLGGSAAIAPQPPEEGPECPSCGALMSPQDTECQICGMAVTPVLVMAAPAPA